MLTTYGRSSGFCVDPIEKKPLNHFYPGSAVLSFGTAGCNLACKFCQNWDISKSREMDTLMDAASPEAIAAAAAAHGCRSVAFTYNDPVIFAEYALDTADACHARGVATVAVTAGYIGAGARRRVLRQDGRGERRPEGVHRRLLRQALRRAPRARAGHAGGDPPRHRLLAGDHDAADPGQERLRRRADGAVPLGRAASSVPTCRCTSPRSIPTTRSPTSPRRRRRRSPGRAGSASPRGCTTSTPATSATARAAPASAPAVARR